jgi:hypothetical protein
MLYDPTVAEIWLLRQKVLLKDFKPFALELTERIKNAAKEAAAGAGRPVQYLTSARTSKEELARALGRERRIKSGLIGIFSAVEPCTSYTVRGNRQTQKLELVLQPSRCTHLYYYFLHPQLGQLHVRVQTWMPFAVDVCLNGREWLARQMSAERLRYEQRDNCFVRIGNIARAQQLCEDQLRLDWAQVLDGLLDRALPMHRELGAPIGQSYYWSASQTEYATDVMFRHPEELAALYPHWLHHGMCTFGSADVLRFLGRPQPSMFRGEVASTLKHRPEGVRLKHWVNGNSLKMYDKEGQVLRIETTINHPREFRVYRPSELDRHGKNKWLRMRSGIADLWRRAEVSRAANARYLGALASVRDTTPLHQVVAPVCKKVRIHSQPYRPLHPWSEDGPLLEIIGRGEYALNGLRNRDVRRHLYPPTHDVDLQHRQSAAVTRKLALLRAHGLIKKVTGTHRWVLTEAGRRVISALLAARNADIDQLTQLAA